jgi:hypothetical protein
MSTPPEVIAPSQRRLQREPDFTGGRLNRFMQVFLRHGLPGLLLGVVCLLVPEMQALLIDALAGFVANPGRYVIWAVGIFFLLLAYTYYLDRRIDAPEVGWILYLLVLSTWEEWVFRLAVPYFAAGEGGDLRTAVIASNVAFGLIHYFTLRWKWQWCLGAFLGGMAFSRQLHEHSDLLIIVGIHWVATTINTPRLPGRGRPDR